MPLDELVRMDKQNIQRSLTVKGNFRGLKGGKTVYFRPKIFWREIFTKALFPTSPFIKTGSFGQVISV
jgi:hypothetical protein